jgi:hypothetical protein
MIKVLIALGSLISAAVFVPSLASAQPNGMFPGMRAGAMPGGSNIRPVPGSGVRLGVPRNFQPMRPVQAGAPGHLRPMPNMRPPSFMPGTGSSRNLGVMPNIVPGTGSSQPDIQVGTSGGRLSSAGAAYYGGFYYGPTPNSYYGSVPYVGDSAGDDCKLVRVRRPTAKGGYRNVVVRQCELSRAP